MDVSSSTWNHCLEHAAVSDVGLRRANNQDSYAITLAGSQTDFQQRGHFFMVADGMGAHAAGELASKMATDVVALVYRKRLDQSPPEAILSALLDANNQIHSRGLASPDFRGMGTTATTLVLLPAGALVAHVGDSRAYRLRDTQIEQLTFDHSLVWELRAAGQASDTELPGYISKNIITRSLGPNAAVQIDLEGPYPVHAGDTFLLCSDGLCGQVKDDEMGVVLSCLPPAEAAQALVDLANLRGGPDNITVLVVRVLGPQVVQDDDSDGADRPTSSGFGSVQPAVWTIMGVAGLAAAGMLAMSHSLLALAGLLIAVVALIVALVQRSAAAERRARIERRRFGRGPYATASGTPTPELLGRLANILGELRTATARENWAVDMAEVDRLSTQAAAAAESGNPRDAARDHLRAISCLMAQLRRLRNASSASGENKAD